MREKAGLALGLLGMVILGPVGGTLLVLGLAWLVLTYHWVGVLGAVLFFLVATGAYWWFLGDWTYRVLLGKDIPTAPSAFPQNGTTGERWPDIS